jgi:hypothetical protein
MFELIKENRLRVIIEPDIYDTQGILGEFLESHNLHIVISFLPYSESGSAFLAEFSLRKDYETEEECGVRIRGGFKTNTQYYVTPDIVDLPFGADEPYRGNRVVGVGKSLEASISSLFEETCRKFLVIRTKTPDYRFVEIPTFNL